MPILDLVRMSKDLVRADRQLQGFEMLIGVLLSQLQRQPGYQAEALLEAVRDGCRGLLEQNPFDPATLPFERIEGILRSRLGTEIEITELPKDWVRGFPDPRGPMLREVDKGS